MLFKYQSSSLFQEFKLVGFNIGVPVTVIPIVVLAVSVGVLIIIPASEFKLSSVSVSYTHLTLPTKA